MTLTAGEISEIGALIFPLKLRGSAFFPHDA